MAKLQGKSESKSNLYFALVILTQAPLVVFALLRYLPLTQGWFTVWADYLLEGKLYKEIFSPLPPLAVVINGVIPALSDNPLQVEQILNVIWWIVLLFTYFKIALLFMGARESALLVVTLGYLYFSEPHDFIAGYFEIAQIFLGMLMLLLCRVSEKLSRKNLILTLFVMNTLPLVKQSFLLSSLAGFVILAIIFREKSASITRLLIGGGLVTTSTFLSLTFIFGPNIFTQLNGSSKKPNVEAIINALVFEPVRILGIVPILLIITALMLIELKRYLHSEQLLQSGLKVSRHNQKTRSDLSSAAILILFVGVSLASYHSVYIKYSLSRFGAITDKDFIAFVVILIVVLSKRLKFASTPIVKGLLLLTVVSTTMYVINLLQISVFELWTYFKVFLWPILWLSVVTGSFGALFMRVIFKDKSSLSKFEIICWLNVTFFVLNSLSGGITIQTIMFAAPVLIAKMLIYAKAQEKNSRLTKNLRNTFVIFSAICIILSQLQVVRNPYTWWALSVPPISESSRKIAIPGMGGFTINRSDAELYEELHSLLKKEMLNDSSREQSILYGPNIRGAQYVFSIVPTYETRCAIMWWDVCPDHVLIHDLKTIQKTPPRLILWVEQPEFVVIGHEAGFRSRVGTSTLRSLQNWINYQIMIGNYRVLHEKYFQTFGIGEKDQMSKIKLMVRDMKN